MRFKNQDILSADQFDRPGLEKLRKLAHRMRKIYDRRVACEVLRHYIMGNFFFEDSRRTQFSHEVAFTRLGGDVITLTDTIPMSSFVKKQESFEDTVRVMQHYCDIMVVRCRNEGQAAIAASLSDKPVINAGDGKGEHPTQALLDWFTIREEKRGKIAGSKVAMMGDLTNGRTVHSLAKLLCLDDDIDFSFIAPLKFQMPSNIVRDIKDKGFRVTLTDDMEKGVKGADVLYVVRTQKERMARAMWRQMKDRYRVTRSFVEKKCKPDITIMHPLPRNSELATDVDDLPNAAYFRMIPNGVLVRMALCALVLGKEEKFI
jgi:aspartate carbamoyltransferase catalytic subunit